MKLVVALIDLLFPSTCCSCSSPCDKALCDSCLNKIGFLEPTGDMKWGRPVALAEYNGVVKEAVHAFKYKNGRRLANQFAGLLMERFDAIVDEADLITFVPLRRAKERQRGYNQAELLAKALARRTGKNALNTLKAVRFVKDQSKLTAGDRKTNVRGAYGTRKGIERQLRGRRILLVDDVFTTGTTVSECSSRLKEAGAKEVQVMTLARTV